jgi:hypothetical protein
MTDILATEPAAAESAPPQSTPKPLLESQSTNERMRHIPRAAWMADKIEHDLRGRIERACRVVDDLPQHDERRTAGDAILRTLCHALERVADVARHVRGAPHPPNELSRHVSWSVNQAVTSLRTIDDEVFGRRFPFQTFERSKAEPLYGALLAVVDATHRLIDAARAVDPNIDADLCEGLVKLEQPLRPEPMA